MKENRAWKNWLFKSNKYESKEEAELCARIRRVIYKRENKINECLSQNEALNYIKKTEKLKELLNKFTNHY